MKIQTFHDALGGEQENGIHDSLSEAVVWLKKATDRIDWGIKFYEQELERLREECENRLRCIGEQDRELERLRPLAERIEALAEEWERHEPFIDELANDAYVLHAKQLREALEEEEE